jgi:hypothetical protein
MTRRHWLFALALFAAALPMFAAKRHAVSPGVGRCVYGALDDATLVLRVTVDDTHVYWWDDFFRSVKRVPKNGGPVETLATAMTLSVYDIAVDDTHVYLSSLPDDGTFNLGPGEIGAVPKTGGEYLTRAHVQFPIALSADNTYVYWANAGTIDPFNGTALDDGSIGRMDKDGGDQRTLAGGLSVPLDVHVDGDDVFFSETGLANDNHSQGIRRVAKTGGTVTHIDDTYAAGELTSNATDIFYYGGELAGEIGGIMRVPKTGAVSTLLVQDPEASAGPIVSDGFVYYVTVLDDDTDAMMRVPAAGGAAEFLFEPQMSEFAFDIDECGIYFGTYHGVLRKAPK